MTITSTTPLQANNPARPLHSDNSLAWDCSKAGHAVVRRIEKKSGVNAPLANSIAQILASQIGFDK